MSSVGDKRENLTRLQENGHVPQRTSHRFDPGVEDSHSHGEGVDAGHVEKQQRNSKDSRSSATRSSPTPYNFPGSHLNLHEVAAPSGQESHVQNPDENPLHRRLTPEDASQSNDTELMRINSMHRRLSRGSRTSARPSSQEFSIRYDIPDSYVNLDELASPPPVQNPDDDPLEHHVRLEEHRDLEQRCSKEKVNERPPESATEKEEIVVSKFVTQLYTISYLILFAILGTLARLGLQRITFYPGAPLVFSEIWANFGGSLFMGFLSEDRMLFREEWGTPTYHRQVEKAKQREQEEENGSAGCEGVVDLSAAKKAHMATKKTIPLYVGLATGFCGSFTSFSSFIRDTFLALSNDLPTPLDHPGSPSFVSTASTVSRNGGYSFMAVLAVVIITVAVSLGGLHIGAHLAIMFEPLTPSLPFAITRRVFDPLGVFLAWGCWLGAIFVAIWPPDRHSTSPELWRGSAVFALVFAPLGCLGRFYASLYLNGKMASFPLGTFAVNVFGTMVLGIAWDLQHVPLGGVVGCQVLQGVEDGFCGCLTTVSTWVSELNALRRTHAYKYGAASILLALCSLVVIMGSLRWTKGFPTILCVY